MKIAVSATGKTKESLMDKRFGRCQYFVLFDDQTKQVDSILNPATTATSDAGPTAVKELAKHKVKAIITGFVGDVAKESLQITGIEIITIEATFVQEAIDFYFNLKRNN
jgi:predicted Fe-Mo cluster-binding NifX family protein